MSKSKCSHLSSPVQQLVLFKVFEVSDIYVAKYIQETPSGKELIYIK